MWAFCAMPPAPMTPMLMDFKTAMLSFVGRYSLIMGAGKGLFNRRLCGTAAPGCDGPCGPRAFPSLRAGHSRGGCATRSLAAGPESPIMEETVVTRRPRFPAARGRATIHARGIVMPTVVGLTFETNGSIRFFTPAQLAVKPGDVVLAETPHGPQLANVVLGPKEMSNDKVPAALRPV